MASAAVYTMVLGFWLCVVYIYLGIAKHQIVYNIGTRRIGLWFMVERETILAGSRPINYAPNLGLYIGLPRVYVLCWYNYNTNIGIIWRICFSVGKHCKWQILQYYWYLIHYYIIVLYLIIILFTRYYTYYIITTWPLNTWRLNAWFLFQQYN